MWLQGPTNAAGPWNSLAASCFKFNQPMHSLAAGCPKGGAPHSVASTTNGAPSAPGHSWHSASGVSRSSAAARTHCHPGSRSIALRWFTTCTMQTLPSLSHCLLPCPAALGEMCLLHPFEGKAKRQQKHEQAHSSPHFTPCLASRRVKILHDIHLPPSLLYTYAPWTSCSDLRHAPWAFNQSTKTDQQQPCFTRPSG